MNGVGRPRSRVTRAWGKLLRMPTAADRKPAAKTTARPATKAAAKTAPKPASKPTPAPVAAADLAPVRFATAKAWDTWLRKNATSSDGVWLLFAKIGADAPTITYPQAIEAALCHGWIDGQKKSFDAQHWLQRFTPRRARSLWSKINCGKALALIESGRMQPSGQAQVDAAKADGRWDAAYEGARTSTVPADLQAALDAAPQAAAFFATLNATNRYAVLWRVQTAVKPETRAKRIGVLVAMLGRGEKIHG